MMTRQFALLILLVYCTVPVYGEDSQAAAVRGNGKVLFWQSSHIGSGAKGACAVEFVFDGRALPIAIENLTLKFKGTSTEGEDLWIERLTLSRPLGGTQNKFVTEMFTTMDLPKRKGVGTIRPLCDKGTRFLVESAIGKQAGNNVDLVRFGQLEYPTFQKVDLVVMKPAMPNHRIERPAAR